MNAKSDYIKGLDSIRAISMMLVLLVHLRLIGFGWVTIQVFFVMSGFLITGILLRLRERLPLGTYLKIFYMRRTLRIFPVYYLTLCLFVGVVFAMGIQGTAREQPVWAFLYVWNWFAILDGGELNHSLEHFWSLAVEEQFYLCWPLLVFFARGNRFWKVALGIVLAGPLIRYLSAMVWPHLDGVLADTHKALYQMSTTHLDAFAMGALLCYVVSHPLSRRFTVLHFVLAVAVAYALGALAAGPGFGRSDPYGMPLYLGYPLHMAANHQYVWGYSVLNLLSAALLLLVAQGRLLPALFQHPLLMRLGTITYGAYVIHLPLLHAAVPWIKMVQEAVGSRYWGNWICAGPLLLVVFLLAELSFRFYESRFLILKDAKFSVDPVPGSGPRAGRAIPDPSVASAP